MTEYAKEPIRIRGILISVSGIILFYALFLPVIFPITKAAYHSFESWTMSDTSPRHPLESAGSFNDLILAGCVMVVCMIVCQAVTFVAIRYLEKIFPSIKLFNERIIGHT